MFGTGDVFDEVKDVGGGFRHEDWEGSVPSVRSSNNSCPLDIEYGQTHVSRPGSQPSSPMHLEFLLRRLGRLDGFRLLEELLSFGDAR